MTAAVVGVMATVVVPAVSGAASNPSANLQPSPGYSGSCATGTVSATCPAGLSGLDALRASEGVVPMSLPTDFASLTGAEQVFVVTDLERVDRGLTPIGGLSSSLDAVAQAGAAVHADPPLPIWGTTTGANWGESPNLFSTDQMWMYQDGWAGAATTNQACSAPTARGCWAHRDNVLGSYASPSLMGAGMTTAGPFTSVAEVFVGDDTRDAASFTWADVTPFLPVGVADSVNVSSLPGKNQVGSVKLWASGEPMNVSLSITGANGVFSLGASGCTLAVGRSCEAAINFRPPAIGQYAASLTVSGPNGVQTVPLNGVASRGYRLIGGDGGVFTFGGAHFLGSTGGIRLNGPIAGMTDDPATGGYWLFASDGGIFSFGAPFFGSAGGLNVGSPIVAMTSTPDGGGYWLVSANGGVFSFGDATFHGSAVGHSSSPMVGVAATPDGGGYWLTAANGGVFSFGDAGFFGSTGGLLLNRPIVGLAATPDGGGYWLVASDGGVFNYGDAGFYGSTGGMALNSPVVGLSIGQPS